MAEEEKSGKFHNVPGEPELWKVGGSSYIVYTIPGSQPPIYLSWVATTEEVKSFFGPSGTVEYDQAISWADYGSRGVLNFGSVVELANYDEDPFLTWAETMDTQSKVQPWILDDDYQALIAMATLEGRQLTEAEIQGTDWWQNHTEGQREWMKVFHGDPQTAQQMIDDNRLKTLQLLKDAGAENPSDALVNAMADAITKGDWSTAHFNQQILAVADPFSGIEVDSALAGLVWSHTGTTMGEEDTVRAMVQEWLGPVHGAWSEHSISKWAGTLRNDPDGAIELENHLRAQRVAMFPEYANENLTYEDIAGPWRTFGEQIWGQQMDEMDPLFGDLIRNNDATVNGALLRKEGLAQNIGTVQQSLEKGALQSLGGTLRQAI